MWWLQSVKKHFMEITVVLLNLVCAQPWQFTACYCYYQPWPKHPQSKPHFRSSREPFTTIARYLLISPDWCCAIMSARSCDARGLRGSSTDHRAAGGSRTGVVFPGVTVLAYEVLQFQVRRISPHCSLNYYCLGKSTWIWVPPCSLEAAQMFFRCKRSVCGTRALQHAAWGIRP